jgi:hypothetical protein
MMDNKDPKEYVWIDSQSSPKAEADAVALFKLLTPRSIPAANSK